MSEKKECNYVAAFIGKRTYPRRWFLIQDEAYKWGFPCWEKTGVMTYVDFLHAQLRKKGITVTSYHDTNLLVSARLSEEAWLSGFEIGMTFWRNPSPFGWGWFSLNDLSCLETTDTTLHIGMLLGMRTSNE